jgi:putative membrane protein
MSVRNSVALMAFMAIATAHAQTPNVSGVEPASTKPNVPSADRRFADEAAQAGAAEINDAQTALKNADRQDIKDFGQHMIDDHSKAAAKLKSLATGEGLTLPSGESAADQKQSDTLQKLSGARFDRQYILTERKAHKAAVALFTAESKNGKDGELKSFAGETLPVLQGHLNMITAMPLTQKSASASLSSGATH